MLIEAVMCMTLTLYHEARGEPLEGQIAVAQVVMHRVSNTRWPNTVCSVVYDNNQFAWVSDSLSDSMKNKELRDKMYTIAYDTIIGKYSEPWYDYTYGATCYTTVETNMVWMKNLPITSYIGNHKFMEC